MRPSPVVPGTCPHFESLLKLYRALSGSRWSLQLRVYTRGGMLLTMQLWDVVILSRVGHFSDTAI